MTVGEYVLRRLSAWGINGIFEGFRHVEEGSLVQARTDPSVPPLPPHITFEQVRGDLSSVLEGDPDRGAMIVRSWRDARDAVESFLPHPDEE